MHMVHFRGLEQLVNTVGALNPLQVDIPGEICRRYWHSVTAVSCSLTSVMVIVHGGRRMGDVISATSLVQFGKNLTHHIMCSHI